MWTWTSFHLNISVHYNGRTHKDTFFQGDLFESSEAEETNVDDSVEGIMEDGLV